MRGDAAKAVRQSLEGEEPRWLLEASGGRVIAAWQSSGDEIPTASCYVVREGRVTRDGPTEPVERALDRCGLPAGAAASIERWLTGVADMNRGAYEEAVTHFTADAEWELGPQFPGPTLHRSPEAIAAFFHSYRAAWGEWRLDARSFHVLDEERLGVDVEMSVRGQASGLPIEARIFQVWTIVDGQVTRVAVYPSADLAPS